MSAQEFAPKLNRTAADVVRFLLNNGEMVTATMSLADEQMELFALEVGAELLLVDPGQQQEIELQAMFDDSDDDDEELQAPRPPVITVMGHVDHGKTTVLDKIRSANVVEGEAGGITQHIGAYQVDRDGHQLTFIDTPGHAAFTQMRARGAQVTDIVVLVVAADDGVMPQTIEAINHARAADVPIIVAVNKIDKDNADPQRVLTQLAEHQLVPESWGGDTIVVEMSALQDLGIDDLLDQLLVVAELEELTANPTGRAKGVVLEANLDNGRGPVATVLVDKGELKVGDPIVAGAAWGRVRAMIDEARATSSSRPARRRPSRCSACRACRAPATSSGPRPTRRSPARSPRRASTTSGSSAQRGDARVKTGVRLEDIFNQIQSGETATLNLILKADVQGSLEAVTESLRKLGRDGCRPDVRAPRRRRHHRERHHARGHHERDDHRLQRPSRPQGTGGWPTPKTSRSAPTRSSTSCSRTSSRRWSACSPPSTRKSSPARPRCARSSGCRAIGAIAGCYVQYGVITRGSKVRFLRDGTIIWKGEITSLRRFKEDAREVREGFECGIGLSDFQDLKPGDIIETFDEREIARYLTAINPESIDMAARGRRPSSSRSSGGHRYPRSARVGETLREIIAEELVRIDDDRLVLVTVTQIEVDNELNRAIVFFDSLAGPDGDGDILDRPR